MENQNEVRKNALTLANEGLANSPSSANLQETPRRLQSSKSRSKFTKAGASKTGSLRSNIAHKLKRRSRGCMKQRNTMKKRDRDLEQFQTDLDKSLIVDATRKGAGNAKEICAMLGIPTQRYAHWFETDREFRVQMYFAVCSR